MGTYPEHTDTTARRCPWSRTIRTGDRCPNGCERSTRSHDPLDAVL